MQQDIVSLKTTGYQIVVGSPGRIAQLLDEQAISTQAVRLFVLDEADKMMEDAHRKYVEFGDFPYFSILFLYT